MFFKTSPASQETPKSDSQKENKKEPTRSFRDVMAARLTPPLPTRQRNVFDLASKDTKKPKPQEKKKESDNAHPVQVQVQEKESVQPGQTEVLSSLEEVGSLSLEMQALVDKMADFVQVESQNGISTTTISVGMEDGMSLFNGSEIQIDHYDTAPHSFNIQLSGTPEAIEIFAQQLGNLQAALQQRLSHFQIQLLPPYLE